MVGSSGKKQHEIGLQSGKHAGIELQRLDLGGSIPAKADVVEAAEGSGIFVLLAHVAFQAKARDVEGPLREIVL